MPAMIVCPVSSFGEACGTTGPRSASFCQATAELVDVGLGLGLDGDGDDGLGEVNFPA